MKSELLSSAVLSLTLGMFIAFDGTFISGVNPILIKGVLLLLLVLTIYIFVRTKNVTSKSIQATILLLAIFADIILQRWVYSFYMHQGH